MPSICMCIMLDHTSHTLMCSKCGVLLFIDASTGILLHIVQLVNVLPCINLRLSCLALIGGLAQVYSFPIHDMIEGLVMRWRNQQPLAWWHRVLLRGAYVVFTGFIACLLPFFGNLMVRGVAIQHTLALVPCLEMPVHPHLPLIFTAWCC